MQLKEEFRTYEALRREHDSQIVQIAMEGGLRIAPDQWSSLLYGDQSHKSHMQSIIDKVPVCLLVCLRQGVCVCLGLLLVLEVAVMYSTSQKFGHTYSFQGFYFYIFLIEE